MVARLEQSDAAMRTQNFGFCHRRLTLFIGNMKTTAANGIVDLYFFVGQTL